MQRFPFALPLCFLLLAAFSCAAQDEPSGNDELPVAKPTSSDELPLAKPTSDEDEPIAEAVVKPGALGSRPLSVNITLNNQSVIRGTLTDTTEMPMKTVFGELTLPLAEVAGIRFASQGDTSTTVVMLNGDSVTGATELQRLTVETEWGAAQINGSGIASILLVPNLQWSSVAGLNGKRWYLTEANTETASANNNNAISVPPSTTTNRPFSSGSGSIQFRPNSFSN
ncbi:MAG: hypothetical protein R3C05_08040 [Pirellulaceae bacterium]